MHTSKMRAIRLNAIVAICYDYLTYWNKPKRPRLSTAQVRVKMERILNFCLEKEFKNGYNMGYKIGHTEGYKDGYDMGYSTCSDLDKSDIDSYQDLG